MKITMTKEIALSAAKDAANRNMKKAGRSQWNWDDWDIASAEYERLWPVENRQQ